MLLEIRFMKYSDWTSSVPSVSKTSSSFCLTWRSDLFDKPPSFDEVTYCSEEPFLISVMLGLGLALSLIILSTSC